MNQLLSQLILAGGLWTVIGTVVVAILYRSKTRAEVRKLENQAAQIADETITKKMAILKQELFDSWGISEERRRVMGKMEEAISAMKRRVQLHGDWDNKVRDVISNMVEELIACGVHINESRLALPEPPSLDFSDIDFNFRLTPPSQDFVVAMAKEKGIEQ